MICVIRIHGRVGVDRKVKETLERLRLGKKYTCVVIANPNKEQVGMIKKVRDFVASGDMKKDVFEKLIDKRGRKIDKKKSIDSKKVVEELEKGKIYESLNLKPFFRLHPPRGGINSKLHFPKGVLGDNKEKINDLVLRML
ncbi:MAG TPA: uL30 family ribosomal protein [Candidatus Nanoarchaeia archaeon]|nr:uL30 family ribosomal protein [Candidatus Nanoarchaeia archaeon]